MGADEPLRVELLDEDIDSIRAFDPESQRSLDKVEAVHMLPGREVPMDEASIARVLAMRERFDVDTRRSSLYQDLKSGLAPAGVEYYLPLFFERTATLFDYLPSGSLPVVCAGAAAEAFWAQTGERYEQRRHDGTAAAAAVGAVPVAGAAARAPERCPAHRGMAADHARIADAHALGEPLPPLPVAARETPAGDALKSFLGHYPGRVLIAADSPGRRGAAGSAAGRRAEAAGGGRPAQLPRRRRALRDRGGTAGGWLRAGRSAHRGADRAPAVPRARRQHPAHAPCRPRAGSDHPRPR